MRPAGSKFLGLRVNISAAVGMFRQPGLHLGHLVGRIVVEHDMDVGGLTNRAVRPAQEN